ncbi:hypothetical protein D6817_03895 [Candidatus Pacearchaeota archaeon]|nr:MAG: hypothetical protein D6817_03895 [Candidatus Pacearchaeota archaeon]
MHLTRAESTTKFPIPRKGTKYLARPLESVDNSVSVVMAVRDMLKLARTAREVKKMINSKVLKINGRIVKDYRESIKLFNVLEADKKYLLTLSTNGKFKLVPSEGNERVCKVIGKKTLNKARTQINLHDGTNFIAGKEKIEIGDSVYVAIPDNKPKKVVKLDKGAKCFVIKGRYIGKEGKVKSREGKKVEIEFADGKIVKIPQGEVIAL